MVNIEEFLTNHNIFYITEGGNVKSDNINVKCPLCFDDHSEHMGIDPETGQWGCWRDSTHRGGKFAKLVKHLLGVSSFEAEELLKNSDIVPEIDELLNQISAVLTETTTVNKAITKLRMPENARKIVKAGATLPFLNYFVNRGFIGSTKLIKFLDERKIQACILGRYPNRLIFPMYYAGELVTWQTRTIKNNQAIPYIDLSKDESIRHVKHTLYNFDELFETGGDVLYITEGIFDCLKMEYYLPKGSRATCIFTKTVTESQTMLLQRLSVKFKKLVILLDRDAQLQALEIYTDLLGLPIEIQELPKGFNDPAELNKINILKLNKNYIDF